MSETNGKAKKKYTKIKTLKVDIEDDNGVEVEYTLKQMLGSELEAFETFKKPLVVEGKPMDGAINAIMNKVLMMTMYGPDGKLIDQAFVESLSFEAKVGLSNDSMILSGGDALAKEAAKNA